ncbi:hypothetical protein [Roseibium sp.]|uniref:hypothetical protein n=1 Tax=Roseibium sp. TaxID=1936156 RepID=UPI003D0DCF5F
MSDNEVLIAIAPSLVRRWVAIFCLGLLGVLVISLVFSDAGGIWPVIFLAFGIGSILAADKFRRASADHIELTREVLRTGSGRVLARIDNVERVERGAFAFKPSNGFLVRLKAPDGKGWAPGLWWKRGKLLGIGGVIAGGQTRAMADVMNALIKGMLPED